MATATVVPVSSSSITTRATSATTRSTAKSLLKETMGDASAKRYEYLFDDDDFALPLADATTVVTTDSPEDSHDDNDDGGGRESYYDEHADLDESHTTTLRRVEQELRESLFRIQQQDELLKRQQQQFQDQHHATQQAIQQCRDVDRKLDVLAQAVVTPLKRQLRAVQQARQQERVKTRQLQELLLQQQQQEDQTAPAASMQQQQQQEYMERIQFQQEQLVLAKDEETKRIVRELVLELEATNQQHQQTIQHMERNFDMERAEWTKKVQDLQRQLRTQTEEAARVVVELKGALEASENSRLEHNLEQGQFASEEDEVVHHHAQEHHQAVTVQKRGKHVASDGVMKLETSDDPLFEQQQPPFHGVPVTPDHHHHHHPTTTSSSTAAATTTTTLVQSLASNDPDVIQAGIALADSLIELLLQGSRDTEVSVLEQMEVLDQLLGGPDTNEVEDAILRSRSPSFLEHCIEEEEDDDHRDQGTYDDKLDTRSMEQEQFMLARQDEDDVSNIEHVDEHDQVDDNDETNAAIQFQEQEEYEELFLRLFERVRELEQERDYMVQESLDMLEAARLANGLELQFQLAEMKERMDRTIQIRLMEELQKHRTIHVVPEEWQTAGYDGGCLYMEGGVGIVNKSLTTSDKDRQAWNTIAERIAF